MALEIYHIISLYMLIKRNDKIILYTSSEQD